MILRVNNSFAADCDAIVAACQEYRGAAEHTINGQGKQIIRLTDLGIKKDNVIAYQDEQIRWLTDNSRNNTPLYVTIAAALGIAAGYIYQNERRN